MNFGHFFSYSLTVKSSQPLSNYDLTTNYFTKSIMDSWVVNHCIRGVYCRMNKGPILRLNRRFSLPSGFYERAIKYMAGAEGKHFFLY